MVEISSEHGIKSGSPIHVKVDSEAGEQYNLKLFKPDKSVLHPNVKVISIGTDRKTGYPTYDSWTPSKEELKAAQDVYVDADNLAAVRVNYEKGERSMIGVVNGRKFEAKDGKTKLYQSAPQNRSDYIDIGRKLTISEQRQTNPALAVDAIVELLVVCDKEFGDVFQHDRAKILEYFTVYFWDVNLRYKTLPSNNISFRVTGIVVISTPSGQPFIEEARAPDGKAEFGRILDRFSPWVYQQINSVPKFDMAVAITNTALEWGGGLAYMRAACSVDNNSQRHWGTLVFNDAGDWGSLTVGAHELAHTLGAPHDDDPNYPGGCTDRGYIMSGGNDDLRWFFSTCSDRTIGDFVGSNEGSCLRTIDESGSPPISPDFSSILAPSKEEQCKRRLNNPDAFIEEVDIPDCKIMKCWIPNEEGGWWIYSLAPVDNSPCGGENRCFRGRCRKPGSLIRNVGDGRCLRATDPFEFTAPIEPANCPQPGIPLDRFVISDEGIGKTLATPWGTRDATETGEKCIYTGNEEGGIMTTDRCNTENQWHGWDFIDVGNGEFLISHRVTSRCAKPEGSYIRTYVNCDRNDANMRWKLE
ncbi:Venom metalloproteinase 3 [Orchesella cincta]|uniref:Venom metalloproteinase 3 n=1 Tax=Orchesella cincta TaxID=48709 RepID=A0A1D2NMF7_ORCCI|nr:Venom metalloproteinase 3 [Orchesella cincta]